jgi:hypothetical protein
VTACALWGGASQPTVKTMRSDGMVVLIFIDVFMIDSYFSKQRLRLDRRKLLQKATKKTKIVNSGGYPPPSVSSFASVSLFIGAFTDY